MRFGGKENTQRWLNQRLHCAVQCGPTPWFKEKNENKTELSCILSSASNAAGVSAFVLTKRAGAAVDFWHGHWKCWTEGGKRDALPSRGAGDSQPGTTLGSDRAVPGPSWGQECRPLSPYISSPTPPRCPRPLISSSHTRTHHLILCFMN